MFRWFLFLGRKMHLKTSLEGQQAILCLPDKQSQYPFSNFVDFFPIGKPEKLSKQRRRTISVTHWAFVSTISTYFGIKRSLNIYNFPSIISTLLPLNLQLQQHFICSVPCSQAFHLAKKFTRCNVIVSCFTSKATSSVSFNYLALAPLLFTICRQYGLFKKVHSALHRASSGALSSNNKYFIDRKTHKMNCGLRSCSFHFFPCSCFRSWIFI